MRVLVTEDDEVLATAVAAGLRREGMAVDVSPRRRRAPGEASLLVKRVLRTSVLLLIRRSCDVQAELAGLLALPLRGQPRLDPGARPLGPARAAAAARTRSPGQWGAPPGTRTRIRGLRADKHKKQHPYRHKPAIVPAHRSSWVTYSQVSCLCPVLEPTRRQTPNFPALAQEKPRSTAVTEFPAPTPQRIMNK